MKRKPKVVEEKDVDSTRAFYDILEEFRDTLALQEVRDLDTGILSEVLREADEGRDI